MVISQKFNNLEIFIVKIILSGQQGNPKDDQSKGDGYEKDYVHRSAGFWKTERKGRILP